MVPRSCSVVITPFWKKSGIAETHLEDSRSEREGGHPEEPEAAVGVLEGSEPSGRVPRHADACLLDEQDQDLVQSRGAEGAGAGGLGESGAPSRITSAGGLGKAA